MKYALLIYTTPDALESLSEDELRSVLDEYMTINESPGVLGGQRLQPVTSATTVRVENGQALLTDGPFIDAKEYLAGFYLFEADDLDAATAIAARIPASRMGGAVEVRPIMELPER